MFSFKAYKKHNFNSVRPYPILLTLYAQYTQNPAVNKLLPFELICTEDLDCIVTSPLLQPYPILLTLYV